MQIPVLSGIYATAAPDLRTALPVNLVPVPKDSGVSNGYLRPGDGIRKLTTGPGTDRGGIEWNGVCYRVMGARLVSVDSTGGVTDHGSVGNNSLPVSLDYSFDDLAIASNENLFYFDGSTITQVTDTDLGDVIDMVWVDGYFMTTDGEFLVVTDLNDSTAVNPLKYGSSEADPDPILALKKIRNEVYALNRHTIEVFDNVGGNLFPFQRIEGAQIQRGTVGTKACCVYDETIAFLGGGRNEQIAVYRGGNGNSVKISTHEIDKVLSGYTPEQLAAVELEQRNEGSHKFLYVHLPDRTLVHDAGASEQIGEAVWFVLTSALNGFARYRARHFTRCYGRWLCADASNIGYIVNDISTHWGEKARWEFATKIIYNESNGAIFNEIEMVGLQGSNILTGEVSTAYSTDGLAWSNERACSVGVVAGTSRRKRIAWFRQGHMRNWRIQRFRGNTDQHIGIVRIEARLEPMAY